MGESKWERLREYAESRRDTLRKTPEESTPHYFYLVGQWAGFDEVCREMDRLDAEQGKGEGK